MYVNMQLMKHYYCKNAPTHLKEKLVVPMLHVDPIVKIEGIC
jgi:hypothetical protein